MRSGLRSIVCAVLWLVAGCRPAVTVMSYNVCGLFDAVSDGTEYATRDADAYSEESFRGKCSVIAGAIRRSVPGGPDIVALQEIENEGVLRTLRDDWLRGLGYHWYAVAGGPPSATRVGVLSRFPIVSARSHLPASAADASLQRAILEVECRAHGVALHVFDNHWKSKIGGVRQTEPSRVESARALATRIRGILSEDPDAEVLVTGDLNEDHDEERLPGASAAALAVGDEGVIRLCGSSAELQEGGERLRLYEPWLARGEEVGSYAYGGVWSTPDHLLLGYGLLDERGLRYRAGSFRVVAIPFLLREGTGLPRGGGRDGDAGYSDHLPILLTLDVVR